MNALKINKDETVVDKNDKEKNLKDNIKPSLSIDVETANFLDKIKDKKAKNKNIAIEDKIKLIDVAQKYQISRYKLEEISGISPQCQRYWEKNLENMKAETNLKRVNFHGQGVKSNFYENEKEIIQFIIDNRKLNLPISTSILIAKISSINEDFSKKIKKRN